jgi:hypothetical protein
VTDGVPILIGEKADKEEQQATSSSMTFLSLQCEVVDMFVF